MRFFKNAFRAVFVAVVLVLVTTPIALTVIGFNKSGDCAAANIPVIGWMLSPGIKWGICSIAGGSERPEAEVVADIHVFQCAEPLPEFTMSADARPSPDEEAAICSCVWENLGSWERRTSQAFVEGREDDVTALNRAAFPARFGQAVAMCEVDE